MSFLKDVKLDAVALAQLDPSFPILANGKYVGKTGREFLARLVLDENDVERTRMLFDMDDFAHTPTIASLRHHSSYASLKLNDAVFHDLSSRQINLNSVVDFDDRVRVSDGATIVGDDGGNSPCAEILFLDAAQFVARFLVVDTVENETSFRVEEKTEGVVGLGDGNNVHETCRKVGVGANTSVHLDNFLHADLLDFLHVECVLQTVTEDDAQRKALAHLVRSRGWSWCPDTIELSKHPVGRRMKALQVLLRSASHD